MRAPWFLAVLTIAACVKMPTSGPGDDDGQGDDDGVGDDDGPGTPPDARHVDDGDLVWADANLTMFTSYPEPGSEECQEFNGCQWAGYFEFVDGQQPESWVMEHNIAAVHSDFGGQYALKTLRVRSGGNEIDVTVYDVCSDSDCDGCCTRNMSETGFLIDLESYTSARFGIEDGIVEYACLDCD